jgi:Domain of unknown function (DUF222)
MRPTAALVTGSGPRGTGRDRPGSSTVKAAELSARGLSTGEALVGNLSEPVGIIECMFDRATSAVVERIAAAARAENQAAGQRLAMIGELDVLWLRRFGERETWCTDTQDAITAEVAAALNITQALAASYLYYSRAMRMRLPRVGALLQAGDIDYRMLSRH